MDLSGRTSGDGMENIEIAKSDVQRKSSNETFPLMSAINNINNNLGKNANVSQTNQRTTSIPGATSIYRRDEENSDAVKLPVKIPQGKQFYLVPHLVNTNKSFTLKNKEPRFVPFEPYKAAVSPMVPEKTTRKQRNHRRNNLDLNTLVSHVSSLTTNEFKNMNLTGANEIESEKAAQMLINEREIVNLKNERDSLDTQLKFQVQVNSELKNLLVAAVGEDLQTRVNVLTEDKLQLARALLNSAQNITTHAEQIEYLANQSEVWRSKFLASSLMVEELARWKASLSQKNTLLLDSNKSMLETMSQLRTMQASILRNLKFLAQLKSLNLPSSNVLDLTNECLNISEQLVLHSGIGIPGNLELGALDASTQSEKMSIEAIEQSSKTLISSDAALKAVVHQAFPQTQKISIGTQTTDANDVHSEN